MWHCHLLSLFEQCKLICVWKLIDMSMEVYMCIELINYIMVKLWLFCACCCFLNIRSAMVNKHLELTKRQVRDHYGTFASPSSNTVAPPRVTRWEAPASAAPLLLSRVCRRWEAPATAALLLLPPLTRMTRWRCGCRLLLLLWHAWCLLLRHAFGCAPTSKRWAYIEHSF
jgi:hypothetical protein